MERSLYQRFFGFMLGRDAAARAEVQSKALIMHCRNCGYERSMWDAGDMRYGGLGYSFVKVRCPSCGEKVMHDITKGPDYPSDTGPAWPLYRFTIGMALLMLLGGGAFFVVMLKLFG